MSINVYCDGGARGNPGPAACAFVVTDTSGRTLYEQGFYLGVATNNQAEYQAVLESLKYLLTQDTKESNINFYLDSLLVVNQLSGHFKIKDTRLQQKNLQIKKFIKSGNLHHLAFTYIPRARNSRADYLVNQTLDAHLQ